MEGGYDKSGNLTRDPGEIEQTERLLPIGFWKGSGLSLMLDIMASLLSQGNAVHEIGSRNHEYNLSQIFIAVDIAENNTVDSEQIINSILDYTRSAGTDFPDQKIFYPGEQTLIRRKKNMRAGIPVDEFYWQQILDMLS